MMMKATSTARARVRWMAAWKAFSVARMKRAVSRGSAAWLCTTGTAFSTSAAMALESATRSWLSRDKLRTRRPIHMVGKTTNTTASNTTDMT